jgi:sensor histidine kinase regulating citrate/malate metabolism
MRFSLQARVTVVVFLITLTALGIYSLFIVRFIEDYIVAQMENRVLGIATTVAEDEEIVRAFGLEQPSLIIQPIAEKIRHVTGTTFVVVFNMDTIRYSHPVPERIGQHFVGGDEKDSLAGKRYVSRAKGTLGLSLRAFVPIHGPAGNQIGVVSVGQLLSDLDSETRKLSSILYTASGISLLVGALGAFLLSRNIKRILLGLEPQEIAAILEERNIIISSIKEGIIAVDKEGQVILINENAKKILGIDDVPVSCRIGDIIPNSKMPTVIASGEADIDEEQILNGKVVLVNRIPMFSKELVIGAVSTFRDMSEIRTMAEELTSVKQYVEGLRAQHHEFLNKLHVISGLLQLKKYRQAIDFIVKIVSRDQEILDYLKTHISVPAISGLLLAKMNEAREAEIEFIFEPGSFFPPAREEYVGPIVTILGNLIQNAIEAVRAGSGKNRKIIIGFSNSDPDFILRVRDTGPGISPDVRSRIFEPGFSTKVTGEKRGMGLYLVLRQVKRLGGSLDVQTDEGVEFFVHLPKERILR